MNFWRYTALGKFETLLSRQQGARTTSMILKMFKTEFLMMNACLHKFILTENSNALVLEGTTEHSLWISVIYPMTCDVESCRPSYNYFVDCFIIGTYLYIKNTESLISVYKVCFLTGL
jgi:hypothetical protein